MMPSFILPDLGEGLTNVRIVSWHVSAGDYVLCDAPLVNVETAKSCIEIPAPYNATIEQIIAPENSHINTGDTLVILRPDKALKSNENTAKEPALVVTQNVCSEPVTHSQIKQPPASIPVMPAARHLAQKLGISLDNIQSSGDVITLKDVELYQNNIAKKHVQDNTSSIRLKANPAAIPATLHDQVNVMSWYQKTDTTARIIQSLIVALSLHPKINAHFSEKKPLLQPKKNIEIGLATQLSTGLFVPVMEPLLAQSSIEDIRQQIDRCKAWNLADRYLEPARLPSVIFSNIGTYAGMYSTPILVPPAVVIIATGKIREAVVSDNGAIISAPILPISITFEHRALTGADVAAFLATMMSNLAYEHTQSVA